MPRMDEQKRYDELVGLCYECVLDDSAWQTLLERLIAASGRQQGALLFWDRSKNAPHVSSINNMCDPSAIDGYNNYYCDLDPSLNFFLPRAVGHWYHDIEDFGPERIRRSPYYQEFHIPHGIHNLSCVKLHERADSGIYLSLLTSVGAPCPDVQHHALLQRISPHLLKATQLSDKINSLKLEIATRDLLLDQHPTALWLLDVDGRLIYCNRAAVQHIGQRGCTLYQSLGRLHSKILDTRLQAMIRRAGGKDGNKCAGWLRLNPLQHQELLITPIPADAPFNHFFQKPLVLLALMESQAPLQLLSELFQLTPAEQRLAELLAQGLTPESCAERLIVSINTVRSQLRALFRKTDTVRQAELVHLFTRVQQR